MSSASPKGGSDVPPPQRTEGSTEEAAAVIQRLMKEKDQKKTLDPVSQQIRDKTEFRLMGYNNGGKETLWQKDVLHVTEVERELILDPQELKKIFETLRKMREESNGPETDKKIDAYILNDTKYGRSGFHAYANTRDILYRVRREGWVLLAGMTTERGRFHPFGYNYGLEKMPLNDDEFPLLSKGTLTAPDYSHNLDPEHTSVNWRSGVRESIDANTLRSLGIDVPEGAEEVSLRRLGIGSALKYILAHVAQARNSSELIFNIGNIYDASPDAEPGRKERIRNTPSYMHNLRIFGDEGLGYRSQPSSIVIKGRGDDIGKREHIATISWYARHHLLSDAVHQLQEPNSVLNQRDWDLPKLENDAERIARQLKKERGPAT